MLLLKQIFRQRIWRSPWLWVTMLIVTGFVVIVSGPWLQVPTDNDIIRIFYRSVSGSMATVMGLVLAIILVAAQVSTRYGHLMVHRIFAVPTLLYFAVFIFVIVFSLILGSEFFIWKYSYLARIIQVKLILVATGALFILMIPYLRWLLVTRLNPETTIESEKQRVVMTCPPRTIPVIIS